MLRYIYFGLLLLCAPLCIKCQGQIPSASTQELSSDFDKNPPFFYKMPSRLSAKDSSPNFHESGQQILLTGRVLQNDGLTPAANVILYYYQTNTDGIYPVDASQPRNMPKNALGQSHGYIRGWVKSDANGRYAIYTLMPGSYPSRNEAAHIHLTVKDPLLKAPYYIDDFVFDNDPLLTSSRRKKLENRGGSGVVRFVKDQNLLVGERDIILGLNIPNYPTPQKKGATSGKAIGEDVLSFTPYHAYGPDQNTYTCPICKYGWYQGILYFVGNHPNWDHIEAWLAFLEKESQKRTKYLKVYFVYGNSNDFDHDARRRKLEALGDKLNLKELALTFVPSFDDHKSEINYNQINPEVQNTFVIYKRSRIVAKFVNLEPNLSHFDTLSQTLDRNKSPYFRFPKVQNSN